MFSIRMGFAPRPRRAAKLADQTPIYNPKGEVVTGLESGTNLSIHQKADRPDNRNTRHAALLGRKKPIAARPMGLAGHRPEGGREHMGGHLRMGWSQAKPLALTVTGKRATDQAAIGSRAKSTEIAKNVDRIPKFAKWA